MSENKYLKWLSSHTPTKWWHDSAIPEEIENSLQNGATGVTTNPPLVAAALKANPDYWRPLLKSIPKDLEPDEKAEEIIKRVTQKNAKALEPVYHATAGSQGYVCAQVNPKKPGDADDMLDMAKRLASWAPNIAVKLPVTAAGLEVLEECIYQGFTITATVSFTLPQVLAIAERHQKALARARAAGRQGGRCFAVVMVGRIDDYIRDVAHDARADVSEPDIIQCGTAIVKRAYALFNEHGYEAVLMPAGMRGAYHAADFAGADMSLSIHPKIQAMIAELPEPFAERISIPVEADVLKRLFKIPEFVRAYEPDGLEPAEFITFGVVQKTLAQFMETGWIPIESFEILGEKS
jgi:transaldolase